MACQVLPNVAHSEYTCNDAFDLAGESPTRGLITTTKPPSAINAYPIAHSNEQDKEFLHYVLQWMRRLS